MPFLTENFVSKLPDRYIWSGLYDANNGSNPRKWTHTDGTPTGATYWQHGQPDNYKGVEWCMAYENGKFGTWDDVPCQAKLKYSVCKKGGVKIA
ncbi:C-type lectin [Aphelenchoides avenae]|nr:C-type lectin [Aphelenchus avenae]